MYGDVNLASVGLKMIDPELAREILEEVHRLASEAEVDLKLDRGLGNSNYSSLTP